MSEKSDKLRAMLEKEKERRIKLNNRIEILERRIQEEDSAEVNEMVRTAKVTPEQLAALLRQSAATTPNPAALSAVGATFEKEDDPAKVDATPGCRQHREQLRFRPGGRTDLPLGVSASRLQKALFSPMAVQHGGKRHPGGLCSSETVN